MKKTYEQWHSEFLKGKTEIRDNCRESLGGQTDGIHSVRTYCDELGLFWQMGLTYTGKIIVRCGGAASEGGVISWDVWTTQHEVDAPKSSGIIIKLQGVLFVFSVLMLTPGCSGKKSVDTVSTPKDASKVAEAASPANQNAGKAPGVESASKQLICKLGIDERILENKQNGAGCELKYTRFNEAKVIAYSTSGPDHCLKVQDQVKANLEKSGFSCIEKSE